MTFARNNLLFYASLPEGYSFAEKIQAAVETGFTEVSLWVPAVEEAVFFLVTNVLVVVGLALFTHLKWPRRNKG